MAILDPDPHSETCYRGVTLPSVRCGMYLPVGTIVPDTLYRFLDAEPTLVHTFPFLPNPYRHWSSRPLPQWGGKGAACYLWSHCYNIFICDPTNG